MAHTGTGREQGLPLASKRTVQDLADALWPVLERKIQTALDRGRPGPPVLQACIRAYEMAPVWEKVSIILRRRRWRPRK